MGCTCNVHFWDDIGPDYECYFAYLCVVGKVSDVNGTASFKHLVRFPDNGAVFGQKNIVKAFSHFFKSGKTIFQNQVWLPNTILNWLNRNTLRSEKRNQCTLWLLWKVNRVFMVIKMHNRYKEEMKFVGYLILNGKFFKLNDFLPILRNSVVKIQ